MTHAPTIYVSPMDSGARNPWAPPGGRQGFWTLHTQADTHTHTNTRLGFGFSHFKGVERPTFSFFVFFLGGGEGLINVPLRARQF